MDEPGDIIKYKWTTESTSLLVSVWADEQIQTKLDQIKPEPALAWTRISKYMKNKGYQVTARQCRSRMKQVLFCYREAQRNGTRGGVERYYDSINRVLEAKRNLKNEINDNNNNNNNKNINNQHNNGIDTVDSRHIPKTPIKEIKTNVNLRVKGNGFQEPVKPLLRRIHVTPEGWKIAHREGDYADSSESNETVLARPRRSMSPVRDVGTNTDTDTLRVSSKSSRRSLPDQQQQQYRYDILENNRFSEMPLKNGVQNVQNVQNQLIQENMLLRNQLGQEYIGIPPQQQEYRVNIGHATIPRETQMYNSLYQQPVRLVSSNCARTQGQLQQYALNTGTTKSEPKKFGGMYGNFVDYPGVGGVGGVGVYGGGGINTNFNKPYKSTSSSGYSPDIGQNLNDGFRQKCKSHNLNETYDQDNELFQSCINATTVTNNATFNDETLSIDFVNDSQSPSDNEPISGSKNDDSFVELPPDAPFRKKKAQKLEQLMLNAITSQTEVVNKILAAQDTMVSRLLDRDADRQSRLENRLDQLMNVVHATVLNKSGSSKDSTNDLQSLNLLPSVPSGPLCFSPPPKPGNRPPKLDLVPPKPCRIPCTSPSANIELINQNPIQTRPGTVKPGSIHTKLGPVSQSPFVKAQQQMTTTTTTTSDYAKALNDWRTKSSAERRIAQSQNPLNDEKIVKFETEQFLLNEKLMEERIENARQAAVQFLNAKENKDKDNKDNTARRELFDNDNKQQEKEKEPSAAVILTRTFLDIERNAEERSRYCLPTLTSLLQINKDMNDSDDLLTGQGESYERLKRLSVRLPSQKKKYNNDNGLDSSTPAKYHNKIDNNINNNNVDDVDDVKPSFSQRQRALMQCQRWRDSATARINKRQTNNNYIDSNKPLSTYETDVQRESRMKTNKWINDRYSYVLDNKAQKDEPTAPSQQQPMGFVKPSLNIHDNEPAYSSVDRNLGFREELLSTYRRAREHDILDEERKYYDRQLDRVSYPPSSREYIERYGQDDKRDNKFKRKSNQDINSTNDEDDIFLDTTTTIKPYRKTSLTSATSGAFSKITDTNCVIS
ncbi:hypothetical protein HCN44_010139 [Aphidius gifuensis]|uniref:Myb/SANT-like DNA-binding domain-containing protein n=1 Tax=Aphidius gifuensis TaxID=684658 RepID=A0A835CS48_APHGI|nr:uncharacterized protein LOC122851728 [Aphidius gifuensis]KAF7993544.1 hypothetical protein HCN44_010139 [Aphidius gifuensis]